MYIYIYICTYSKGDVLYFTLVHFEILLQNIPCGLLDKNVITSEGYLG